MQKPTVLSTIKTSADLWAIWLASPFPFHFPFLLPPFFSFFFYCNSVHQGGWFSPSRTAELEALLSPKPHHSCQFYISFPQDFRNTSLDGWKRKMLAVLKCQMGTGCWAHCQWECLWSENSAVRRKAFFMPFWYLAGHHLMALIFLCLSVCL